MSEQNGTQETMLQRPADDDNEAWKAYWKEQGQPWRTETEIDEEREQFLEQRRSITPDIIRGIYPFNGIKLSRADVEWLLATHDNGCGPVDWSDENQRQREGLDLRGADLHNLDLSCLPLTGMLGSLNAEEWRRSTSIEESRMAEVNLDGAYLNGVHLERANLRRAHMQRAELYEAHLEGADLLLAQLVDSFLYKAHLEGTNLRRANLETANLARAHLEGCNLCLASFNSRTILENITLGNEKFGFASLSDVDWNGVNLAVVNWSQINMLGDERVARISKTVDGKTKDKTSRLKEYEAAVRANRQLATVLRNQGLNEDAARFTYRAQLMERKVFLYEHKFAKYLGSFFLDLLSGYGYKVGRCFIAYVLVIGIFATIYHFLGTNPSWNESIVISMTAFHGRGFFPEQFHPGDPQALAAAIEAFVGLLIEITLIATLTQRLFGK